LVPPGVPYLREAMNKEQGPNFTCRRTEKKVNNGCCGLDAY